MLRAPHTHTAIKTYCKERSEKKRNLFYDFFFLEWSGKKRAQLLINCNKHIKIAFFRKTKNTSWSLLIVNSSIGIVRLNMSEEKNADFQLKNLRVFMNSIDFSSFRVLFQPRISATVPMMTNRQHRKYLFCEKFMFFLEYLKCMFARLCKKKTKKKSLINHQRGESKQKMSCIRHSLWERNTGFGADAAHSAPSDWKHIFFDWETLINQKLKCTFLVEFNQYGALEHPRKIDYISIPFRT